jgi:quercetin dioxygenase-like cupin family protein
MADAFQVRRVVVGRGEDGAPTIISDATPPLTIDAPTGFGVSELLSSSGPLTTADAGGDPPREAVGAFPENGGVAARLIRFPATNEWVRIAGDDPERPGMHRSETLDLMVVLSGRIVLGVEDGETEVGAGDAVVQRGTLHRWRVAGEEPCTYLSVLLAPVDGPPAPSPELPQLQPAGGPQLLVTGQGTQGSTISVNGTSAPDEHGRRLWWDTGGALRSVDQGGLSVGGDDRNRPPGGAVAFTMVDLAVAGDAGFRSAAGGIELILVLSGTATATPHAVNGASPPDADPQLDKLSLSAGDVLLIRDVGLRLTSTRGALAVVTFTPAPS